MAITWLRCHPFFSSDILQRAASPGTSLTWTANRQLVLHLEGLAGRVTSEGCASPAGPGAILMETRPSSAQASDARNRVPERHAAHRCAILFMAYPHCRLAHFNVPLHQEAQGAVLATPLTQGAPR